MSFLIVVFFFNDTATTEIYTLSLHDALPILVGGLGALAEVAVDAALGHPLGLLLADQHVVDPQAHLAVRSEEHTSELQSRQYLVCRLLLEKKKKKHLMQTLSYYPELLTHPPD